MKLACFAYVGKVARGAQDDVYGWGVCACSVG